ncbi:GNAT family N-acetyltransferase [Pseudonocardia sp.]|uniref:GNAT family N-acetyltransferase n=1 Tax=Pseudonocardia sp. TaxID=60912 RepID=UPI003D0DC582
MTVPRQSLFCDLALAHRIEAAEAGLVAAGAEAAGARGDGFVIPVAGGVAAFADVGSPLNKVAGLGFAGTPTPAELDRIEDEFARRGAPVQVELAHLADPDIGAALTARGYRLVGFENVLGRALADLPLPVAPGGVDVRRSGDEEFDLWVDVLSEGIATPDVKGVVSHESFPREVLAAAMRDMAASGAARYLAWVGGTAAGGASVRVVDGVAQMTGAATIPAQRRRGVQAALLAARLADVVAAGCDVAVVTTQGGSTSQNNVQRQHFDLLYTRAVLVKG